MVWGIFKPDSVSEAYKKMKAEELKGKQHKLDVDKDGKIEGEDLAKLRATKKEEVEVEEATNPHATNDRVYSTPTGTVHRAKPGAYGGYKKDKEEVKLKSPKALDKMDKALTKEETEEVDEAMQKSDVPAYLRKQKGEKPLTVADVKGPRKDSISHKDNLAKLRNEELDIFSEEEVDMLISEVLKASDDAGKWISDFIKSDDPRFAGDSKEQRKKRALAAYYAAQKKESVDYDSFLEEAAQGEIVKSGSKQIKHANVKDKEDDQDIMEPNSEGETDFIDKHTVIVTDDPGKDFKSGAERMAVSNKPVGKGPASYDGKSKLGIKESSKEDSEEDEYDDEEEYDDEDDSKKESKSAKGKKTYFSFKEKSNCQKS